MNLSYLEIREQITSPRNCSTANSADEPRLVAARDARKLEYLITNEALFCNYYNLVV